jgi:hypothetical protein
MVAIIIIDNLVYTENYQKERELIVYILASIMGVVNLILQVNFFYNLKKVRIWIECTTPEEL